MHPKWQEKIFPALQNTFPNIQFIVSTHAPKVLESVDENIQVIRLHEDAETHLVLAEPMEPMNGWDVNTILEDYMDTEVYNRKTTELLEQINVYLNEKAYDEAAEYTITKLNLNDKRLCRARENALWTFNVFQLNGEEKQRELL